MKKVILHSSLHVNSTVSVTVSYTFSTCPAHPSTSLSPRQCTFLTDTCGNGKWKRKRKVRVVVNFLFLPFFRIHFFFAMHTTTTNIFTNISTTKKQTNNRGGTKEQKKTTTRTHIFVRRSTFSPSSPSSTRSLLPSPVMTPNSEGLSHVRCIVFVCQ